MFSVSSKKKKIMNGTKVASFTVVGDVLLKRPYQLFNCFINHFNIYNSLILPNTYLGT